MSDVKAAEDIQRRDTKTLKRMSGKEGTKHQQ